jgi:hypothetical protein
MTEAQALWVSLLLTLTLAVFHWLALLGLTTFMGLEFWARAGARKEGKSEGVLASGVQGGAVATRVEADGTRRFFYVHLGSFALYNFLIT